MEKVGEVIVDSAVIRMGDPLYIYEDCLEILTGDGHYDVFIEKGEKGSVVRLVLERQDV